MALFEQIINTHSSFLGTLRHSFLDEDRKTALQNFELKGFPTKKDEEYKYTNLKETLQGTLLMAQKTAEAKEETSNRQAEAIISDAKVRAERILLDAASERDSLAGEMFRIRQERQHFIAEFHGLLSRFKSILDATEKPSEPAAEAGCGQSGA